MGYGIFNEARQQGDDIPQDQPPDRPPIIASNLPPLYPLHPGIIGPFRDSWAFLSNFYPLRNFEWCGRQWRTLEHAFQASKCVRGEEATRIWACEKPGEAKKLGRTVELAKGWEENKVQLMHALLGVKFEDPYLARRLEETGERELVEVNERGDTFWGVSDGRGYNYLGLLLMLVREYHADDVPW
jgi:ribA/ribD-fused uncharacterized protein